MASAAEGVVPKGDYQSDKSVARSGSDVEKQAAPAADQLQRKLSSRHLQFVAIGEPCSFTVTLSCSNYDQVEL